MEYRRKQVRGRNRLSGALNKPIGGELGKRRSKFSVAVFAIIAMIGFGLYFTSELGLKAGIIVTITALGVVIYTLYERKFFIVFLVNRNGRHLIEISEHSLGVRSYPAPQIAKGNTCPPMSLFSPHLLDKCPAQHSGNLVPLLHLYFAYINGTDLQHQFL